MNFNKLESRKKSNDYFNMKQYNPTYEASFYGRALIMERRIGRMEPNFDGRLPQLKEHCQREHNKENESTELNLINL